MTQATGREPHVTLTAGRGPCVTKLELRAHTFLKVYPYSIKGGISVHELISIFFVFLFFVSAGGE